MVVVALLYLMWIAQGILAALYERQRPGTGRLVECSLLETAIGFSSWTSAQWLVDHEEPTREGSRHRQNAPYQRMRTKDGYLMIGAAGLLMVKVKLKLSPTMPSLLPSIENSECRCVSPR